MVYTRALTKKRVQFALQKYVQGDDFADDSEGYWENVAIIAGAINPRSGRESVVGSQMTGLVTYVINVRNPCCPITSSNRLVRLTDGRVYNMTAVVPLDEYERWLQIQVVQTDEVTDVKQDGCDSCQGQ